MIDYTNTQTIFDALKTASNSNLWTIAGEIMRLHKRASKKETEGTEGTVLTDEYIASLNIDELISDPGKLRTRVMASLIKESDSGNAQASDKLAKIGGLESIKHNVSIVTESFKDTVIDCPVCGSNVYAPLPIEPDESPQK